jgi:DNA polymerase III epsilon subunit-like protein
LPWWFALEFAFAQNPEYSCLLLKDIDTALMGLFAFSFQNEVLALLDGTHKIVGHALENDFEVLKLPLPPATRLRDTAYNRQLCPRGPRKLKVLAQERLGMSESDFQSEGKAHSSVDDARVALMVYHSVHKQCVNKLSLNRLFVHCTQL